MVVKLHKKWQPSTSQVNPINSTKNRLSPKFLQFIEVLKSLPGSVLVRYFIVHLMADKTWFNFSLKGEQILIGQVNQGGLPCIVLPKMAKKK